MTVTHRFLIRYETNSGRTVVGEMSDSSDDEGGKDYVAKLDEELEEMYAEYTARTQRRAVHAIKEEDGNGPTSKKKKREARLQAIERAAETPDELARRVAASQIKNAAEREAYDADEKVDESSDDDDELDAAALKRNPLLVRQSQLGGGARAAETKTDRWFANPLFSGLEEEDDEAEVAALAAASRAKRQRKGDKEKWAREDADAKEVAEAKEKLAKAKPSEGKAAEGKAAEGKAAAGKAVGKAAGKAEEKAGAAASGDDGKVKLSKRGEKRSAKPEVAATAEAGSVPVPRPTTKGGKKPRLLVGDVPDDAKYVDVEPEDGKTKVTGGRFAQYDSADDEPPEGESSQAALDRQVLVTAVASITAVTAITAVMAEGCTVSNACVGSDGRTAEGYVHFSSSALPLLTLPFFRPRRSCSGK